MDVSLRRRRTGKGGKSGKGDGKTDKDAKEKGCEKSMRQKKKGSGKTLTGGKRKLGRKKYDHDSPTSDDQKANFQNFLKQLYDLGVTGILNQYNTGLKAFVPEGITRIAFDKNMNRNRYKDVICVDATRVVLSDGGEVDYIHANHIPDPALVNKFICTQGPMVHTVGDFWRMIVQENVENILMLCETVELGKEKCQQYWPLQVGNSLEFSGTAIKNVEVDNKSNTATIVTTLEVTRGDSTLTVKHHQWRTWPDRSVPQSVMAPFRLLKIARSSSRATVVHCSAGVGRTGTVVALEICLQRLLSGKNLCVMTAVQQLRSLRMHCVQTDLQLVFINKCLAAFAASKSLITDELRPKHDKFETEYSKLIADRTKPELEVGYTPLVPIAGFNQGAAATGKPEGGFFLPLNAQQPPPGGPGAANGAPAAGQTGTQSLNE